EYTHSPCALASLRRGGHWGCPFVRPRALGQAVGGEQRTRWPQPRQFDYSGTALAEGGPRPSRRGFFVGTRVAAALPRQPAFASKLFQMVLACYASWQHRKESTDALHCNRCLGFCIYGICLRRKQRPQSHPERRRSRHGEQGGRGNRTADRQAGNLLA